MKDTLIYGKQQQEIEQDAFLFKCGLLVFIFVDHCEDYMYIKIPFTTAFNFSFEIMYMSLHTNLYSMMLYEVWLFWYAVWISFAAALSWLFQVKAEIWLQSMALQLQKHTQSIVNIAGALLILLHHKESVKQIAWLMLMPAQNQFSCI